MATKSKKATPKPKTGKPRTRNPIALKVGSTLEREFKGKPVKVLVTEDGFKYGGEKFTSITAVAKKITGYTISGPVFFGLAKAKKAA